jgi:hypothetical protein
LGIAVIAVTDAIGVRPTGNRQNRSLSSLSEQLSCERRIWASDRAPASFAGTNARREHPYSKEFPGSSFRAQQEISIKTLLEGYKHELGRIAVLR